MRRGRSPTIPFPQTLGPHPETPPARISCGHGQLSPSNLVVARSSPQETRRVPNRVVIHDVAVLVLAPCSTAPDLTTITYNRSLSAHSEGGKRADGASKGRVTQVNIGHLRSTTVTRKWGLSWENVSDQHFCLKTHGGSIPPKLHRVSKWPLTRAFVEVTQGRQIPPSYPQGCDQGKRGRSGRGNLGVATPGSKSGAAKPQVNSGDVQTALGQGGKRADDDTVTTN
jgi:hypothetical protein